jgi:hypothetical protein
MKQLATITQGQSDYDPKLRAILDESGIDPHEFVGLDYLSLTPFFVLAGATVAPEVHAHGDHLHVTAINVTIEEDYEEAFLEVLPQMLEDAYVDEDEEDEPETNGVAG